MTRRSVTCYVGLGANLGEPIATLKAAAQAIANSSDCRDVRSSSIYRSAPQETTSAQPDYFNAVVSFSTTASAATVWKDLQTIERSLGRTRTQERNSARTIDIDFLLYGDTTIDTSELTLPHPRIAQRAFVLLPLLELAPNIAIPNGGFARDALDRVKHQRIERVESESLLPCN